MMIYKVSILVFIAIYHINGETVYISLLNGVDNQQCGGEQKPCKTLEYAWEEKLNLRNSSNFSFMLYEGYYLSKEKNTLKFGCESMQNASITISSVRNATHVPYVELNYSFMISRCQIQFNGISFRESPNHIFLSSNVVFKDTIMSDIKGTVSFLQSIALLNNFRLENSTAVGENGVYFSDCSEVRLSNVAFTNNTMPHLLLVKAVTRLVISTVTFSKNFDSSVLMAYSTAPSIFSFQIINNNNFNVIFNNFDLKLLNTFNIAGNSRTKLEVIEKSTIVILSLFLMENVGNDENIKYVNVRQNSVLAMSMGTIDCNKFNNSKVTSFFEVDNSSRFACGDCEMWNCPMMCPAPGEGIYEKIFCKKCMPGSSAHDWERTCSLCFEGSYTTSNASSDCALCPVDTYCNERGCRSCKSCSNDFLTSSEGSAMCAKLKPLLIGIIAGVVLLTFGPITCLVAKKYKRNASTDSENDDTKSDDRVQIIS